MTPVLAAFARAHPQVRLEVQSDLSHALWQAFEGESWIWPSSSRGRGRGSPSPAGASPGLG